MARKQFGNLGEFLESVKKVEEKAVRSAITRSINEEAQKVLNETTVKMSMVNQVSEHPDQNVQKTLKDTSKLIKEGVIESIQTAGAKAESVLSELLLGQDADGSREKVWIDKLCGMFSIPKDLPYNEKCKLVDDNLQENPTMLAFVSQMIEKGM